jgi:hypothetical protein
MRAHVRALARESVRADVRKYFMTPSWHQVGGAVFRFTQQSAIASALQVPNMQS